MVLTLERHQPVEYGPAPALGVVVSRAQDEGEIPDPARVHTLEHGRHEDRERDRVVVWELDPAQQRMRDDAQPLLLPLNPNGYIIPM